MKKWLTIVILIIMIIGTFGFAVLKVGSLGERDNWFNRELRSDLSRSRFARTVFALHDNGDGRYDYLSNGTKAVTIEIDTLAGQTLAGGTLQKVERDFEEILTADVRIVASSEIPGGLDSASPEELAEQCRSFRATSENAVFYLLVLKLDSKNPSQVGSTFREDGAVIYAQAIENLGSTNRVVLESSTILHEFLHQLGMGHVNQPKCIMDEAVEVGGVRSSIPTKLCAEELELLNQIKATIN